MSGSYDLDLTKADVKALKGSIEKWRKIIFEGGTDKGTENCPLCDLYINKTGSCKECPVMLITDKQQCGGSPYQIWTGHHTKHHGEFGYEKCKCKTCVELATQEYMFLKGILYGNGK